MTIKHLISFVLIFLLLVYIVGCKSINGTKYNKPSLNLHSNDSIANKSDSQNILGMFANRKSYTIVGQDSIDHFISKPDSIPSILSKVFPNVEFYFETDAVSSISSHLMCNYKGQNYNLLMSFNFLMDRMKYKYEITFKDKILALITLREKLFSKIQIESLTNCSQKINQNIPPFNMKIEILIDGKNSNYSLFAISQRIYFLAYKNGEEYSIFQLEPLPLNYKMQ